MPSSGTTGSLLRTKLHRPPVPRDHVTRPRLDVGLLTTYPVTLVSAAAGFGKSVLVSGWLESWTAPSAWVSLDESDNDLRQFLSYVCAGVEAVFPSSLPEVCDLLEAPTLPPVTVLARTLVNELDAIEEPFVLVLDDVHRIRERAVLDLLTELMEHPPRHLHLVLIGRRDPFLPIARLRARNQLAEVRSEDLSFTVEETETFLENVLGTDVSAAVAGTWRERTEGWATGLRLAALALRGGAEVPERPFGERKPVRDVTSYLMGEVLERQSLAVRDHLLRSSVAARFCARLCDALAVAEGPDAKDAEPMDGAEFVEWVEQAGLFVIPLDAEQGWLRYHHLFQDLLFEEAKRRLGAEAIATLHSRASEWFEAEGLVTESIEHALAAGDEDRAADIVVGHRREALNADHWYFLEKWLALLTDAVVRERAELLLARVWILVHHYQFAEVPEILDHIESLLGDTAEDESLRGEVFLMRGYMLFFLGQGAESVRQIEQALERVPVSFYEARAQCEVIFALSSQMEGRMELATRGLDELLRSYQSPSNHRKTRLLITHVFIDVLSGDLTGAKRSNLTLRHVVGASQYGYVLAWTDYMQGLIHLHRWELAEAAEYLKRSAAKRFIHFKRAAVDSIAALMLVYRATGRSDQAETTRRLLGDFTESLGDPSLSILAGACEARLSLMDGRLEPAIQWMKSKMLPGAEAPIWWLEVPGVTRCRALIAEGSAESLSEAEKQLTELAELCEAHHNTCQLIPVLALKALALDKQGHAAEALRVLEEAVRLARPGGFIFPFVEPGPDMRRLLSRLRPEGEEQVFVRRILAAFAEVGAATPAGDSADEPALAADSRPGAGTTAADLTSRELDVLELLGERLQDKEIAAQLYVTKHTVNHHLKRIYRKLGVSGRRQAVKRAAELGILQRDDTL